MCVTTSKVIKSPSPRIVIVCLAANGSAGCFPQPELKTWKGELGITMVFTDVNSCSLTKWWNSENQQRKTIWNHQPMSSNSAFIKHLNMCFSLRDPWDTSNVLHFWRNRIVKMENIQWLFRRQWMDHKRVHKGFCADENHVCLKITTVSF